MIATLVGVLLTGVSGYVVYTGDGFLVATAGNIFANFATDWLNATGRFCDDVYLARYKGIDENHIVVRGVREAQLEALNTVLQRFDAARRNHPDLAQKTFAELMREFLRREKALASKLRFDGAPEATEAEKRLRLDLGPVSS